MTNPTPERSDRAKTAEEIAKEHVGCTCGEYSCEHIVALAEVLKSYADSVANTRAEERVNEYSKKVNQQMMDDFEHWKELNTADFRAGYRDGQERMRERAAQIPKSHAICLQNIHYNCATDIGDKIRSLEVEEERTEKSKHSLIETLKLVKFHLANDDPGQALEALATEIYSAEEAVRQEIIKRCNEIRDCEIRAAAEEAVATENQRCIDFFLSQPFAKELKAEAYEDAAKIADYHATVFGDLNYERASKDIANAIRDKAKDLK